MKRYFYLKFVIWFQDTHLEEKILAILRIRSLK